MNELDRRPFRALVVDDEEIVVSLVKDALEDDGLLIESAGSGEEALSLCKNFDCQLLITDIRMPGIDGIELAARVRELYPDTLVVFMTGYANLNSAKDAIKQGAFDYIMKPFELTEIRQTVRKAITAIKEAAHKTQESTLSHLSDLNRMMFTANDRDSLITSSLRFAMMHQQADDGAIMVRGDQPGSSLLIEISDDLIDRREIDLTNRPCLLDLVDGTVLLEPMLLGSLEDMPLRAEVDGSIPGTVSLARWMHDLTAAIVIPVRRKGELSALMFLGFADDSITVRGADLSFLAITASQLGISLENISLLEETQAAYAKLESAPGRDDRTGKDGHSRSALRRNRARAKQLPRRCRRQSLAA